MVKKFIAILTVSLLASLIATSQASANEQLVDEDIDLSAVPDKIWDVDDRSGLSRHTAVYKTLVWDLYELNGVMYVGGDFTTVVGPDGSRHNHSFLAAFDIVTGNWIDSFQPQLNNVVYSLSSTADGNIVAGGEFDGGVQVLNPTTGTKVAGFDAAITHSWGNPAVFTVAVSGNSIYAGGRFVKSHDQTVQNLVKLDATSGLPDPVWAPTVQPAVVNGVNKQRVNDIEIDEARGRVYVAGRFAGINNAAETDSLAVLDPTSGDVLMDHPNVTYDGAREIAFLYDIEVGDEMLYYGGKENFTISVDPDSFSRQREVIYTNNGDHQIIHEGKDTVWIGCHCWRQGFTADPPNNPFAPTPDAIDVTAVFGVDRITGKVQQMPTDLRGSAGAWDIIEDSNGRLWVAGQFTRAAGKRRTGLVRYSPEEIVDTGVTACEAVRDGDSVTVTWDAAVSPDTFVVRRSVNDGTVYFRGRTSGDAATFTDTDRSGSLAYFVEAKVGSQVVGERATCEVTVDEADEIVQGLRVTRVTKERVVLNWQANQPVEIARDGVIIATHSGRWYTDRTVESETTYNYAVRYVGSQTWSDPVTVTTL